MKTQNFNVVTGESVERILYSNIFEVYDIIKNTYAEHEKKNTVNPNSFFLRFPDEEATRIIALPAALNFSPKIAGIKWIGSNPKNIEEGKERASAVIILNDYKTKYPLACIEGAIISKVRTACSAVLAAEYLNKNGKDIKKIGFVGCGPISTGILQIFRLMEWDIKEILLFDIDAKRAENFVKDNNIPETIASSVPSYESLIRNSDIVIFGTSAIKPYIHNADLFSHNPIVLHISLRDIGTDIISKAQNFTDDIEHVLNANTSLDLLYRSCGHSNFIHGTLPALINKKISANYNSLRIFSPMGLGVLDLALARYVFQKAIETKSNIVIENFF